MRKILFLGFLISVFISCSKDDYGTYEFFDKNSTGIFKLDLSKANITNKFGYKNYELLSDSELADYFERLQGMNFRKIGEQSLLIDNYNFSQKVDLTKDDNGYAFIVIYDLPIQSDEYASPLQIIFQGHIVGNKIIASYSCIVEFYTYEQEWIYNVSYDFEAPLRWIDQAEWEPGAPQIEEIADLGKGRGIRIYFSQNKYDFVKTTEYRIYRINDITRSITNIQIGSIKNDGSEYYYYNDFSDWAKSASYLSTPAYLVTAVGENGIESFTTQESYKAIVLER